MGKKQTNNNTLIKRNQLIKFLKEKRIERASPKALTEIEKLIKNYLAKTLDKAKENMTINGRTTLKKQDIQANSQNSTEENYRL
jgi:histone H3/H4